MLKATYVENKETGIKSKKQSSKCIECPIEGYDDEGPWKIVFHQQNLG